MDDKQAEYLIAIDEHRSISKAAGSLFITQPALSKFLKQQEEKLGCVLFDREREMEPTYEGRIFLNFVRRYLADYKQTIEVIKDIQNGERGDIYIGVPTARLNSFFSAFLCSFLKKYPQIHVELVADTIKELFKALDSGRIDMVCMVPRTEDEDMEYINLLKEELCVVAREELVKDYILPDGSLSICSLDPVPFVGLNKDFHLRKLTEKLFEEYKIHKEPYFESMSLQLVSALVGRGIGFTISTVSQLGLPNDDPTSIRFFSIHEERVFWELGVAVRRNKYLSNRYSVFINDLKEYLINSEPK